MTLPCEWSGRVHQTTMDGRDRNDLPVVLTVLARCRTPADISALTCQCQTEHTRRHASPQVEAPRRLSPPSLYILTMSGDRIKELVSNLRSSDCQKNAKAWSGSVPCWAGSSTTTIAWPRSSFSRAMRFFDCTAVSDGDELRVGSAFARFHENDAAESRPAAGIFGVDVAVNRAHDAAGQPERPRTTQTVT